jgi:hypothetical protein
MELPPKELEVLVAYFELLAEIEAENGGIIKLESGGNGGL